MAQRWLLDLAVSEYPDVTPAFQRALTEQRDTIEQWWCSADLGDRALRRHPVKPLHDRRDVEDTLHEASLRTLDADDVLVLVVTGHGRLGTSARHYLELPGTDRATLLATGFPTGEIVAAALSSRAEHVLVIVNCCHAGQLRGELDTLLKDLHPDRRVLPTLAVFSTGDFTQRPRVTDLTELLRRTDRQLRTSAGITGAHLTAEQFRAELVRAARSEPPLLEPIMVWPPGTADRPTLCLPNPGHVTRPRIVAAALDEVATDAAEFDYWVTRASGRFSAQDEGWYFTGRERLNQELTRFLRDGAGLFVVTGAAGTGKSAIIARMVTLSDRNLRAHPRYRPAVQAAPDDTLPEPGAIDAAVLARNKDTVTIGIDLLSALGTTPRTPLPGENIRDVLRAQLAEVVHHRGPVTVVVDGLDEADDPMTVIADRLAPLLRLTDATGGRLVRMIVGLRSSDGPGDRTHLLDQLVGAAGEPVRIIRTDGPDTHADVREYVGALLAGSAGPYATAPPARQAAAATIDDTVAPSFLDARLAAQRLLAADVIQDLHDPHWRAGLAEGTVGLLRADLDAEAHDHNDREQLLAVLRATAFAEGAGLPWSDIWAAVAEAVLDAPIPNADAVITRVLGGRLTGYLTRAREDGHTVHRPAHDLLTRALRDSADRLREQR